jgi:hypothetical protein
VATATEPEVVVVDGEEFYQWKTVLRVPKNWTPESGVFIAVAPPGGIANFPAAIQGKPGLPITIRNSSIVALAWDDPTPASFGWTLITAGTGTTQPVYDVTLTVHEGAPGAAGTMTMLDATDLTGTPTAGYILRINSAADGVEIVAMRVGNTYWPTSVTTLSNATGANAVAAVTIPPQLFPWRPIVHGQDIVSYDGPDVQVDLVARLGGTGTGTGATDGQVVARGLGLPGSAALMQVLSFAAAPPVNSTAGFGQVAAGGSGTTIYIRVEQVGSGTDTFDTVSGKALFSVDVKAVG